MSQLNTSTNRFTFDRPGWAQRVEDDGEGVHFLTDAGTSVTTGEDDEQRHHTVMLGQTIEVVVNDSGSASVEVTFEHGEPCIYLPGWNEISIDAARQLAAALGELIEAYDGGVSA